MTDFAGYYINMESFTISTDSGGSANVVLTGTPVADEAIIIYCQNPLRYAEFVSRSEGTVTMQIRKLRYDKVDHTDTDANNLPAGVSPASSKSTTDTDTGESGAPLGGPAAVRYHGHGISWQYKHSHNISSFSTGTCPFATSESNINIVVLYATLG